MPKEPKYEVKMMLHYKIILYWSQEYQAFIAEVPELPGCAADGKTYQEAVQNVEVIMQEWIETAKECDRPIPEPKRRLMIRKKPGFCDNFGISTGRLLQKPGFCKNRCKSKML